MAISPWKHLPPSTDDVTITFPADGELVWVRMRAWTRRPFLAIWHDGSATNPKCDYVIAYDAGRAGEINNFSVPWYELDAWHYP